VKNKEVRAVREECNGWQFGLQFLQPQIARMGTNEADEDCGFVIPLISSSPLRLERRTRLAG